MPYKTQQVIECCHYCVAPKRNPGCHDHCKEYQDEKAEYERRKVAYYGNTEIKAGLTAQRTAAVAKAQKGRKNRFRNSGKGRMDN